MLPVAASPSESVAVKLNDRTRLFSPFWAANVIERVLKDEAELTGPIVQESETSNTVRGASVP